MAAAWDKVGGVGVYIENFKTCISWPFLTMTEQTATLPGSNLQGFPYFCSAKSAQNINNPP